MESSRQISFRAAFALIATAVLPAWPALTYPDCPPVQGADFAIDTLVRNSGGGAVQEPLKMAFDMDAQGNVDVYFTQRYGKIRKYSGASRTTVDLTDFAYGLDSVPAPTAPPSTTTLGVHGIALDPGFKGNGWLYLWVAVGNAQTTGSSAWRLSRYKVTGNTLDRASEKTLFRFTTPSHGQHMGGALRFDWDGNLWISVGDNGGVNNPNTYNTISLYQAANTNSYLGKILRIKPRPLADNQAAPAPGVGSTYDLPPGNLFPPGTVSTLPEIYVMGTRNPYTMTLDTVRRAVTFGDVGPDDWPNGTSVDSLQSEEFNFTAVPGNFGWPFRVGSNRTPPGKTGGGGTHQNPVNNHPSNTGLVNLPPMIPSLVPYGRDCAVTGPVYYYSPGLASSVKFPPHFHGAWFVGDFNKNFIDAIQLNANGTSVLERVKVFTGGSNASGFLAAFPVLPTSTGMLEMEMGPDGALYVLNYGGYRSTTANTGIYRIRYKGACRPTVVSLAPDHPVRRAANLRFDGAFLDVAAAGEHRVEIRDLAGRLIWARRGDGRARYDVRAVAGGSGLHILTLTTPSGRFTERFLR